MTSSEQVPADQPRAVALDLLRAYHGSMQALQPLLIEYVESGPTDEDMATIYELCGNTWDMLGAIHDAAERRIPKVTETHIEPTVLQLVQPTAVEPVKAPQPEAPSSKPKVSELEKPLISYAATLNIPADFDDRLNELLEQYDGRVNIAAVIKRILCTEQLSSRAFQELSTLLHERSSLEHTSRGFFVRKGTEAAPVTRSSEQSTRAQSIATKDLDKQIRDAVGSPAPVWKPKQRGRYR